MTYVSTCITKKELKAIAVGALRRTYGFAPAMSTITLLEYSPVDHVKCRAMYLRFAVNMDSWVGAEYTTNGREAFLEAKYEDGERKWLS